MAIFLGATFIFLFLFMEETNYVRATVGIVEKTSGTSSPVLEDEVTGPEKNPKVLTSQNSTAQDITNGTAYPKEKTFVQKLSIWQPSPGQPMFTRAWARNPQRTISLSLPLRAPSPALRHLSDRYSS